MARSIRPVSIAFRRRKDCGSFGCFCRTLSTLFSFSSFKVDWCRVAAEDVVWRRSRDLPPVEKCGFNGCGDVIDGWRREFSDQWKMILQNPFFKLNAGLLPGGCGRWQMSTGSADGVGADRWNLRVLYSDRRLADETGNPSADFEIT